MDFFCNKLDGYIWSLCVVEIGMLVKFEIE